MERALPSFGIALVLIVFVVFSFVVVPPRVSSDSTSYLTAMSVVRMGMAPEQFTPNRILTTYLGMRSVIAVQSLGFDIFTAWIFVNGFFFVIGGIFFFLLLESLFHDRQVSLLGTLVLMGNYTAICFGLNYLMDMGGWAFYLVSIWCAARLLMTGKIQNAYYGALAVGVGGLFKEYGFLGAIPLAGALFCVLWGSWRRLVGHFAGIVAVSAIPVVLLYCYVWYQFGYTYLDWLSHNEVHYGRMYISRLLEYVKVFGSLFTFMWFFALPGMFVYICSLSKLFRDKIEYFLTLVFLSGLPVFVWPAITQRVFFVSVVFLTLLVALFLSRDIRRVRLAIPFVALYLLSTFVMDVYILPNVSFDTVLHYFL